jgi:hypothetical protein
MRELAAGLSMAYGPAQSPRRSEVVRRRNPTRGPYNRSARWRRASAAGISHVRAGCARPEKAGHLSMIPREKSPQVFALRVPSGHRTHETHHQREQWNGTRPHRRALRYARALARDTHRPAREPGRCTVRASTIWRRAYTFEHLKDASSESTTPFRLASDAQWVSGSSLAQQRS